MGLIQDQARMTAKDLNETGSEGSTICLQKFSDRSNVHFSFEILSKSYSLPPVGQANRIHEIRSIGLQ